MDTDEMVEDLKRSKTIPDVPRGIHPRRKALPDSAPAFWLFGFSEHFQLCRLQETYDTYMQHTVTAEDYFTRWPVCESTIAEEQKALKRDHTNGQRISLNID